MLDKIMEVVSATSKETLRIVFIVIITFFALMVLLTFITIISRKLKEKEKAGRILFPEKYSYILNTEEVKKKVKTKKEFFLKRIYKEYVFYYKNGRFVLIVGLVGYLITSVILYAMSGSLPVSFILGLTFLVILYIFVDGKTTKARKKYIKDFAAAINTLAVSTEAGNTLEKGIQTIIQRTDTIGEKIRQEFAYVNNDLKNNRSLEEALDGLYERNKGIQEITMFVIVISFFSKKGGEGLRDILNELSQSLTNKINNYSEIDAEIGIYKGLMNFFIYGYFLVIMLVNLFYPTFYANIIDQGSLGIIKCVGSILVYTFAIYFYRMLLRNSAEG